MHKALRAMLVSWLVVSVLWNLPQNCKMHQLACILAPCCIFSIIAMFFMFKCQSYLHLSDPYRSDSHESDPHMGCPWCHSNRSDLQQRQGCLPSNSNKQPTSFYWTPTSASIYNTQCALPHTDVQSKRNSHDSNKPAEHTHTHLNTVITTATYVLPAPIAHP